MAKLTLNNIEAGYLSNTAYNENNAAIVAALENTLSRDGAIPNQMLANLDMNSKDILNVNNIGVVSLDIGGSSIQDTIDAAVASATASATSSAASASASSASAANSASTASTAAINAASSAVTAQNAATTALSYTTSGFMGTATLVDLGFVNDAVVYFPTDLGVL